MVYKKGTDNGAVDALSRRPHPDSSLFHVTSVVPQWMDQVLNSYEADTFSQQLLLTLATTTDNTGPYTLQSGILRYKGHVWVGSCEALQIQIISEAAWQIISLDFIEVLPRSAHALANHKSSDNPGGKHNFFTSPALATQI